MKNKTNIIKPTLRTFIISGSILCAASFGLFPAEAHAFAPPTPSASIQSTDIIIIKTRFYNGKQQYRRWNDTKSCWVDPDWIDLK